MKNGSRTKRLTLQLMEAQNYCRQAGYVEAFQWLGKNIALLENLDKAKKPRRKQGQWVRLKATGQRVMLDRAKVREGEEVK